MVTLETLEHLNINIHNDRTNNLRAESTLAFGERTRTSDSKNIYFDDKQISIPGQIQEINPGQIHEINPELSTKTILAINDQPESNNSNSNTSNEVDEPTEQQKLYEEVHSWFELYGKVVGYNVDHRTNLYKCIMFYNTNLFATVTGLIYVYTIYIHRNDKTVLEPLAVSGLYISCVMKWITGIKYRPYIISLIVSIKKFCKPNIFGRQAEIVKKALRKTMINIKIFRAGVGLALCVALTTPLFVYLLTGGVMSIAPLEIIYLDQSEPFGYFTTNVIIFLVTTHATIAIVYYTSALIFCIGNYTFRVKLIAEDFHKLDELWNGENNIPLQYKRDFLNNICKKRQDMNDYLVVFNQIFETKLFLYFCVNYFSQIICLYDVTQNNWLVGYSLAIGLFLEMMFYCYIGTQVALVDDELCFVIYDCNWYSYDLESQRKIQMLLHEAQQSKELQLGVIGPLNLVTGITIIKSIYSYYTVLTELF